MSICNYTNFADVEWGATMKSSHDNQSSKSTVMKYIAYTVSLYFNHVKSRLYAFRKTLLNIVGFESQARWSWWNPIITEGKATLYLGALPLVQSVFGKVIRNDLETLSGLGVGAVLSVTEPFENNAQGIFLTPVPPKDWESKGVHHLQLSTPDFKTISMEKVHEGVEFIRWNINEGRSVYVHCKAGRARSALIEACYLIKYHNMTAEDARDHLMGQRNQVDLGSGKWETIKEFESEVSRSR